MSKDYHWADDYKERYGIGTTTPEEVAAVKEIEEGIRRDLGDWVVALIHISYAAQAADVANYTPPHAE